MNLRRINDNSAKAKEYFSDVDELTSRLSDKTLNQLEQDGILIFPETVQESEDIVQDEMVLRSVNEQYQTSNMMGFVGYKDQVLIISSRFSSDSDDFFLQYLLRTVLDVPNIVDLPMQINSKNQLLDLLCFLFPYYLRSSIRKGIFKEYIRRQYNDPNAKGVIDVARHIKQNTPFLGKVAYSQREFSTDNALMQLIRHTIEYIKTRLFGSKLLNRMQDEIQQVIEATSAYEFNDRMRIVRVNSVKPVRHAYYREYRDLQKLCLLILRGQRGEFGSADHQFYGVLFDGAWLWEEYINTLIGDKFYHPRNKAGEGAQKLFCCAQKIYPDFISRATENRVIADAKYKPKQNIRRNDYFQLLSYMYRFDAKRGYYLYPEMTDNKPIDLFLNRGTTYEHNVEPRNDVKVTKLGLKIPTMGYSSYEEFVEQMNQNEKEFIAQLWDV